jgi:hypothetical protein
MFFSRGAISWCNSGVARRVFLVVALFSCLAAAETQQSPESAAGPAEGPVERAGQPPENEVHPPVPEQSTPPGLPADEVLQGENKITNGDFESVYQLADPLRSCVTPAHRGLCAAEFVEDLQKKPDYLLTNMVPLAGAEGFTAEVWTRVTRVENGALHLRVWVEDASKNRLVTLTLGKISAPEEDWTRHRVHLKAEELPNNAAAVGICVLWMSETDTPPSGTVYLDDIALVFD